MSEGRVTVGEKSVLVRMVYISTSGLFPSKKIGSVS